MTTEDFIQHDICPRLRTYSSQFEPLRVSINWALNESIHHALSESSPIAASERMISLASQPGIDLESKGLYESVIHHSHLAELISTYLLSVGRVKVPDPISCDWGDFQPYSFLMENGRLRRVVLCDRWNSERESAERFSWRTAIDTALLNRPMVITAIVIGGLKEGFRPSPWTQGFIHPQNSSTRVKRREGEFGDNWRSVYREQTSIKPLEWLRIMQEDGAFEGRVISVVQDVPLNRDEVVAQIGEMAREMGSFRQTRSNCYRFKPCSFLPACQAAKSPAQMGWIEKDSLVNSEHDRLSVII